MEMQSKQTVHNEWSMEIYVKEDKQCNINDQWKCKSKQCKINGQWLMEIK